MNPKNPFLTAGYHSPDYFCDREKETSALISAVNNDRNVTLVAPRRMGKSGLVKNVFYHLERQGEYRCAYVDIFGTQCLADFVKVFATGVFTSFETSFEKISKMSSMFLRGYRPSITFDAYGTQKYSFDVQPSAAEATLAGVFDYLESLKFRTVIAFDEFQQIADFPEKGAEAMLRSRIQFLTGHQFIFSGSRQRMMSEMFSSAKRPFYHSTQMMHIGPIDRERYFDFANLRFANVGRALDREVFMSVYDRFDGVTWYVQSVMNRLFELSIKRPTLDDVNEAVEFLVAGSVYEYEAILRGCSDGAVRLLKAIAAEGRVAEVTCGGFISRHRLRAASSVSAAMKTLDEADLVYRAEGGYEIYDKLFGIWLSRLP